jgi:hypothetical protein
MGNIIGHIQTFDGDRSNHFVGCISHNINGGITLPAFGGFQFINVSHLCGTYVVVDGHRFHVIHDRQSNFPAGDSFRLMIMLLSDRPGEHTMYRNIQESDHAHLDKAFEM